MQGNQKQQSRRALSSHAEAILRGKAKTDKAKASDEANKMREFDKVSTQLIKGIHDLESMFQEQIKHTVNASHGHQRQTSNDHTIQKWREQARGQALPDSTNSRHSSDMHRRHRGMRDDEHGESDHQESDEDTYHSSQNVYQSSTTSVGSRTGTKGKPSNKDGPPRGGKREEATGLKPKGHQAARKRQIA